MEGIKRDTEIAWRRLRATPAFTVFAVVTLAIGIAVTTATWSIVGVILGPTAGVRDPKTLVNLNHAPAGGIPFIRLSWPDYQDFRLQQTAFESVTAWMFVRQAFTANGRAEVAFGEIVGGEYFQVLGVRAATGRMLQASDDALGAAPVAVVSYRVWQRVFDSAPDVVGRIIQMNGRSFEVVGVAPASFHGLFNNGFVPSALWVPIAAVRHLGGDRTGFTLDPTDREARWLLIRGRLKPGRTLSEAQAEVTGIARHLDAAFPIGRDVDPRLRMPSSLTTRQWTLRPSSRVILNENVDPLIRPLAAVLMAAVGLVLLIACTNLANLMMARGTDRRHEVAVRLALGASRGRLVREALSESLILAGIGGILSLALTRGLLIVIGNQMDFGNGAVLRVEPAMDAFVLIGSAGATLFALLVAGVGPAVQATRVDVRTALASDGGSTTLPRWRGRRLLIALQVAVSLLLLAAASVCVTQLRAEHRHDSGLDLGRIAALQVDFKLQQYDQTRSRRITEALLVGIASQPGVEAVAASSGLPIGLSSPGGWIRAPDGTGTTRVELLASTPDILKVLGVAVVRGRALEARDNPATPAVVVLSKYTAQALFGTIDVVGRAAILKRTHWVGEPQPIDEAVMIVGVATDTDTGSLGRRDHGTAYLSLDRHFESNLVFSARADDAAAVVAVMRRRLTAIDPELAVARAGTGTAIAAAGNLFLPVTAVLAGMLGSFALVLVLAGLYGALAHVVSRRTREIGIRVALGASGRQISAMVTRDGLVPVALGLIFGACLAVLLRSAIQPMFVRLLPPLDPLALTIAPASMLLAAVVACALPARRAANVEPNVALRMR